MQIEPKTLFIAYLVTAGVFFMIDLVWLGVVAKGFYARHVGGLLREGVNWAAAVLFYLIYIAGIQVFVLAPAMSAGAGILATAVKGGLLGFFAYATFDLTALALLRGWSVTVTLVDMLWGTVLTACTSALALFILRVLVLKTY